MGELQFIRAVTACQPGGTTCPQNILADYDLANPYYNWSIHADQLKSVRLVNGSNGNPSETSIDTIPLDEAPTIHARYRSSAPATEQDEVVFFARDPEELYATLLNDLTLFVNSPFGTFGTDNDWQNVDLVPNALPQGLGLSYPPAVFFPPPGGWLTTALPVLGPFGFFNIPTTVQPTGPGAAPDGSGSVKAARVVQHGRCSRELGYTTGDSLLSAFLGALDVKLLQLASSRQVAAVIPFLHQTESREDAQWGGFFLTAEYTKGLFVVPNLHARVVDPYVFQLQDGIVSVLPEGALAHLEGGAFGAADQVHWFLDEFLDTPFDPSALITTAERIPSPANVAQAFYQAADDAQGVTSDKDKTKALTCSLRPVVFGNSRTIPKLSPICAGLYQVIGAAPGNFASTVTPPLSVNEQAAATSAIMETIPDPYNPSGSIYKNFRCNPAWPDGTAVDPSDPSQGVCEVVARAKRINSYPNSLELVFFDDEREVTAEAYALFLFLGGDLGAARGNDLCKRTPVSSLNSLTPRPFTWAELGPSP